MVPQRKDDTIVWPPGAIDVQCEQPSSGHWLMVGSHRGRMSKEQLDKNVQLFNPSS